MSLLDFDALWDFEHPDRAETAFLQLLPQAERNSDRSYYLQLLTQIARTQGLQRRFTEAHKTLDIVKEQLSAELVVPTIRYLLERARAFNSSGQPSEAQTWFQQAWNLARIHEDATFFTVDAAHMLAVDVMNLLSFSFQPTQIMVFGRRTDDVEEDILKRGILSFALSTFA